MNVTDKSAYCPFCNPEIGREIITENDTAFALYDRYPVNDGHVLIIPKRHCSNYFELSEEEQSACWRLVNELQSFIQKKYNPDGFNIGINVNEAAGQTVPHVHIHLIPRYKGDISEPEGGVRGVIPDKRQYKPQTHLKTKRKRPQIENLINSISTEKLDQIVQEIQNKKTWIINTAQTQHVFDETHIKMACDIRDNKTPERPDSLNCLMIQLISSAFSFNRIRKQFRKINREAFNCDYYPTCKDYQKLLAYLLEDNRFLDVVYWHPVNLQSLINEIEKKGQYKNLDIISKFWLEHIMDILRTAPIRLIEITNQDVNAFYDIIDDISKKDYGQDLFKKAEALWDFATQLSVGIRNVGTNLMCDFLKESGFTDYAKMDVHLIRSMSEVLNISDGSRLTDYESFVVTQWLAEKLKMTPFRLDKILYIYGVYHSGHNH